MHAFLFKGRGIARYQRGRRTMLSNAWLIAIQVGGDSPARKWHGPTSATLAQYIGIISTCM